MPLGPDPRPCLLEKPTQLMGPLRLLCLRRVEAHCTSCAGATAGYSGGGATAYPAEESGKVCTVAG